MAIRTERTELVGFKELEKALNQMPREVAGKMLVPATRAGAGIIRDAAREAAPRRFGILKQSIIAAQDKALAGLRGASVVFKIGPTRRGFYGGFDEFGTSKQPARPWFRPAFYRVRDAVITRIGDVLAVKIELAARRIARRFAVRGRRWR